MIISPYEDEEILDGITNPDIANDDGSDTIKDEAGIAKEDISENPYLKSKFLIENITQMSNFRKDDNDFIMLMLGNEGCLTGDTIINYNRASLGRKCTLKKMYDEYHQNPQDKGKKWNMDIPTYVRSFDGKSIRLHKITDVVYSGEKEVWTLTLENNRTIKATSDHKIMTINGWVELKKLAVNDEVMCDNLIYSKVQSIILHKGIEKTYDIICDEPYHNFVANGMVVHNSGKSTLAAKIARYIDTISPDGKEHFTMENVVFTAEDFLLAINRAKLYDIIVFDEAVQGLYSKDSLSGPTIAIEKLLTVIRWKRLMIILCIPDIFMVNPYIRGRRSRGMIRTVFMKDRYGGLHKGYFKFYSSAKLVSIKRDANTRQTLWPSPNFIGKFKGFDDGDKFWAKYLKKKKNMSSETKSNKKAISLQSKRNKMLQETFSIQDIMRMNGCSRGTVKGWLKKGIWPKKAIITTFNHTVGGYGQKRIYTKYYKKGMERLNKQYDKRRKQQSEKMKLARKGGKKITKGW